MTFIREEDRAAAERKKKLLLALYVAIACVYVVGAVLLLVFSSDSYIPYLIADILFTIAFGFYSIYFFTVAYSYAVREYRLLEKMLGALEEREYGVFLREEAPLTVEGLEMRSFLFLVNGVEREIKLFRGEISLEEGKKYTLEIRCGILKGIGGADV